MCVHVLQRERDVPSVSYDHREFIDGELPELKLTQHLLPNSKKDSEKRQIFCLCVCPSVGVTHIFTQKVVSNPKAVLHCVSKGAVHDVRLCNI